MRLSDYLIRPICTSTEPSGQYNLQLEAYKMAVKLMNGMAQPTVCDIEQIRADIELQKKGFPPSADYYKAISRALDIIDKYTKGERE